MLQLVRGYAVLWGLCSVAVAELRTKLFGFRCSLRSFLPSVTARLRSDAIPPPGHLLESHPWIPRIVSWRKALGSGDLWVCRLVPLSGLVKRETLIWGIPLNTGPPFLPMHREDGLGASSTTKHIATSLQANKKQKTSSSDCPADPSPSLRQLNYCTLGL